MRNKIGTRFIVVLLVLNGCFGFLSLESEVAKANTIFVGGSGGGNFSTIQTAIDSASAGDTIFVYDDIASYYENIIINKSLNLIGENKEKTIINGSGSGDVVYITADWVNITGFTITWGGVFLGDTGIELDNVQNCRITNNNISTNRWENSGGIRIISSSYNYVANNDLLNSLEGIDISLSSYNNVTGNNVITTRGISIDIESSNNNSITKNNISDGTFGIFIRNSPNNLISNNNISDNSVSITIYESTTNEIVNNDLLEGGIYIWGYQLSDFNSHNIPSSNKVNGKPIYYYKNCSNININGTTIGQIIIANCTNLNVSNLQIDNTHVGIQIGHSSNITLKNNNLSNNYHGIYMMWSSCNDISNNNVSLGKGIGIIIQFSSNSNKVTENNVMDYHNGIILSSAYYNRVYHNNLINNEYHHASDNTNENHWNDTYPSSGNYWSDYSPTCQDLYSGSITPQTNGSPDGICDFQYNIDSDSIDYYPLKYLLGTPDEIPPIISNEKPSNGSTVNSSTPTIGTNFSDFSGIDISSILLKVDGNDVTSNTLKNQNGMIYTPIVALQEGSHTVYIEVSDNIGNKATLAWSFIIDTTSPTITNLHPSNATNVNISTPAISANYSDGIGINVSSIMLRVDSIDVTLAATILADGIIYTPESALAEGSHTVYIEVRDYSGNLATKTWIFTVNTTSITDKQPIGNFLSDYWWIFLVIGVVIITVILILFQQNKGKREKEKIIGENKTDEELVRQGKTQD